jgi:hypothetical protein
MVGPVERAEALTVLTRHHAVSAGDGALVCRFCPEDEWPCQDVVAARAVVRPPAIPKQRGVRRRT